MSQPSNSKRDQYSEKIDPKETGTWAAGIRNQEILLLFGEIFGDWVHIEEAMIDILDALIFPNGKSLRQVENKSRGFSPGRQIFRPIGSNGTRAKVLGAGSEAFKLIDDAFIYLANARRVHTGRRHQIK